MRGRRARRSRSPPGSGLCCSSTWDGDLENASQSVRAEGRMDLQICRRVLSNDRWCVHMAHAVAAHLPPRFVPSTLSPCCWQHWVAQGGSEHPIHLRSRTWLLVPAGRLRPAGAKPTHAAQGSGSTRRGTVVSFCRVLGVSLVGETGLFQRGAVRGSSMKRAVCFHPDSQRWRLQSQEENLFPQSAQGTSAAHGCFLS